MCNEVFALGFHISHNGESVMASWAIFFFVIALVAALFGFGGIAGDAAWIGQVLLFVFLVLAVISMLMGRRTVRV
jgi:uncharacterized membrane protein YtjA (UPF0391 family)